MILLLKIWTQPRAVIGSQSYQIIPLANVTGLKTTGLPLCQWSLSIPQTQMCTSVRNLGSYTEKRTVKTLDIANLLPLFLSDTSKKAKTRTASKV